MNLGMNPGVSLSGEPLVIESGGMDVITTSGSYIIKAPNFEITLIGGGGGGVTNSAGGQAGPSIIKRISNYPVGTALDVIIGAGGSQSNGGSSSCVIPGYPSLVTGVSNAVPTGGDINLAGETGSGLDQNGNGGFGGSTLLGFGGAPTRRGIGFGSGSGAGTSGGGVQTGQSGVMVVRYF